MDFFGVSLSWLLFGLLFTLLAIFWYKHYTILKRCGIHGPTPLPLVGNLPQIIYRGINHTDEEWSRKYGKVFGYYNGYRPVVAVTDPDIIKAILIKDFQNFRDRPHNGNLPKLLINGLFFMRGHSWKRTRNIITPTFSAGKLKNLVPIINRCAETLTHNLEKEIGKVITVKKWFVCFTLDAIAATAFGIDLDSQRDQDDPFVQNLEKIFKSNRWARISIFLTAMLPTLGKWLYKLGMSLWPAESVDFYDNIGQALIDERRKNKVDKVDFLQMLIDAEFDNTKEEYIHNENTLSNGVSNGHHVHQVERLSDDEIKGQTFVFFLAGFETTASLLRYSAYILAFHPEMDSQLYDEIQKHIGQVDPNYDNIGKLKFMDQFINEVLRFFPPVPRLVRKAQEDITIGEITIPKGASVQIPVWNIHHHEDNYPEPEAFKPERFAQGKKGATENITYLPFGSGPRNCIGMRLALVEAKIALVYMLQKIRFVKCDKTQEPPLDLDHFNILRPAKPVQVRIEAR